MDLSWLHVSSLGFLHIHFVGKPQKLQGPYHYVLVDRDSNHGWGKCISFVGWGLIVYASCSCIVLSMAFPYVTFWDKELGCPKLARLYI